MFPTFTWYSTPLLILYIWGMVFTILLVIRYFKHKNISDLLLAAVLFIHTYNRTTYTVGFMAWYDNFPNTKINYFLPDSILLLGPLIYFYVKSVCQPDFKFKKIDKWHFMPMIVYLIYRVFIFIYDINQEGFNDVQNGKLFSSLSMRYVGLFVNLLGTVSLGIYLTISFQRYLEYNKKIKELFSNTFKVELAWLRNFISIFFILFLINIILGEIDGKFADLHYTDYWWGHIAAAISLIYLGIYGYFLDVNKFHSVNIDAGATQLKEVNTPISKKENTPPSAGRKKLQAYIESEKPYLNPSITLAELASKINLHPNELSQVINKEEGMNFNDYINSHRVEAVKASIQSGRADQFTLLTIAYESGFNSKATFNRTFKKFTNQSPSQFLKSIS